MAISHLANKMSAITRHMFTGKRLYNERKEKLCDKNLIGFRVQYNNSIWRAYKKQNRCYRGEVFI